MKNKLDGKTMTKFVGLRGKTYIHLIVDGSEDKKAKSTKKICYKKNAEIRELWKISRKKNQLQL